MPSEPSNRCCPTDTGAAKCHYEPRGDDMYVVGPYDAKAGIIIVGDIFGMLPNSKRLADMFAEHGYVAVMPDFFGETAWPNAEWPPDFQSERWNAFVAKILKMEDFMPRMEKAIALLHQLGCQKIGAMGMCWGATLPFLMAGQGKIDAVAAAHPSFFKADCVKGAKTPVLVLPSMDEPEMEDVEAAVTKHPMEPHVFKRLLSLPHGFFSSRYDPDTYTPEQMRETSEAQQVALDFFKKTLH